MTSTKPPTKPTRPKRSASVSVHLSPEEKAKLDKAAFQEDLGTSQFVRRIILRTLEGPKDVGRN